MKSAVLKSALPLVFVVMTPLAIMAQNIAPTSANPAPPDTAVPTESDRAWNALLVEKHAADVLASDDAKNNDLTHRRAGRAARGKALADRAHDFYVAYPNHPAVSEARKMEVFSLIETLENGDASGAERLEQAVGSFRKDTNAPSSIRAQAAAAFEFTKALRPLKVAKEKINETASVARKLAKEFPDDPQAYEALLVVAKASSRDASEKIALEVIESRAPERFKAAAQTLLDRYALEGRTLTEVFGEPGAGLLAGLPSSTPVIVYSWATCDRPARLHRLGPQR